jgi:peptidoglycan/xylan/chitin deacetylase (PgdA/CDA1 family)
LLAVSPENFEAHLKELAENYRVIPLHQLREEVRHDKLNANTIALTFDDGYLDNLTNAVPLLEKYGLHATIFVTSGMVGSDQEFWWDTMERVFLTGNALPELLSITTSDGIKEWNLTTAEGRLHALDNIGGFLRSRPYERINLFINNLLEQVGIEQEGRLTHRIVNAEQLKKLANSPSIEIGSHSVTHTKLSILSPEGQRQEIRESRNQLESIIQKPVRIFSYPFGTVDDFTTDTAKIVKEEGYEAGIANIQGSVVESINMYSIPRRLVRNWPELLFARWLKEKDKAKLEAETISARTKKLVDYQLRIST